MLRYTYATVWVVFIRMMYICIYYRSHIKQTGGKTRRCPCTQNTCSLLMHRLDVYHCIAINLHTLWCRCTTFTTVAVRPPQKVNWEIPTSTVEFLQPHTVALTFAAAAIRLISIFFGDRKTAADVRWLHDRRTVAVGIFRRRCGDRRNRPGSCAFWVLLLVRHWISFNS